MKLKHRIIDFRLLTALFATLMASSAVVAAQMPNPRGGTNTVARGNASSEKERIVSRVADNTVHRVSNDATARVAKTVKPSTTRSAKRQMTAISNRPDVVTARVGSIGVVRSANPVHSTTSNVARSATNVSNVSRAATSRATAVFSDISKIGGGYATCRDAYATCMDQFCANANDTYRRCYCSQKFTEFRDTELALDEAKRLLLQFQDNNLNAVDKTASEVNAMYTATVGEAAIKTDVSGAQSVLNEIGDLLSGKKAVSKETSASALGSLDVDFGMDMEDIWSGGSSSSSIFGGNATTNMADLEGAALYKAVNSQCLEVVASSCENNAVLSMATNSYNIMITQDCNAYEKKVNTQRKAVEDSVRQAEKYLREARLDEYRTHNSADVNECVAKVRNAITQDTACGTNYARCLDYSGVYINSTTGEPIYSPRLFKLVELIKLDGSADVMGQNSDFNKFLDSKRMFATTALDTCRDQADIVWNEFKRSALIEIAQAQDEKIEQVKNTCVSTMAECYDTQSGALKDFSDQTAVAAGAVSAYAARQMCADKVLTCAALYGDTSNCRFDNNGKFAGNQGSCGLTALLNFVDTVDTIKINDSCVAALQENANEICTPTSRDGVYPSACFNKSQADIEGMVTNRAELVCNIADFGILGEDMKTTIESTKIAIVQNIKDDIESALMAECEAQNGIWFSRDVVDGESEEIGLSILEPEALFYTKLFGGSVPSKFTANSSDVKQAYGICAENSMRYACMNQDTMTGGHGYAKYDAATNSCVFTSEWYKWQCENVLNGYFENEVCYWNAENVVDGGNE